MSFLKKLVFASIVGLVISLTLSHSNAEITVENKDIKTDINGNSNSVNNGVIINEQSDASGQSISGGVYGGRDVTIIQSQPSGIDKLGDSLKSQKDQFIGALDGQYTNKENGMIAEADYDKNEMTFISGNCLFTTILKQNGDSWDLYLKETDGICEFLKQLEVGKRIMRIIPVPSAKANSGRVLEFVAQSGEFPINDFFGVYVLK